MTKTSSIFTARRGAAGFRWQAVLLMALGLSSVSMPSTAAQGLEPDIADAPVNATVRPARPPRHHYSPGEIIDANVRRLARGLDLDPGQQMKLRGILVEHHQQLARLRLNEGSETDASGALRATVDRTRDRIRSILTDEQRTKYAADVLGQLPGPTRADLDHWLEARDAAASQAAGAVPKEN